MLESFSTNVVANVHLFNIFIPLLKKGQMKKAIVISSGMADSELTANYDLEAAGPYSISKAAINMAVAKFAAEYKKDGILFLSICPGFVETGHYANSKTVSHLQHALLTFYSYGGANAGGRKDGPKVRRVCSSLHWPCDTPRIREGCSKGYLER